MRKGDTVTYLVQIFNKPHQIAALKVLHALAIFLPIQYIAELVVKVE